MSTVHPYLRCMPHLRIDSERAVVSLNQQTTVGKMIHNKQSWEALTTYAATTVLKAKKLAVRWEEGEDQGAQTGRLNQSGLQGSKRTPPEVILNKPFRGAP
uniref:Nucleoside diphosphate-linked moiety X motif 13 n=1 Tax=Lygus hesperus TaxID=30085 RepID=A0A0A9YN17_LYGHE